MLVWDIIDPQPDDCLVQTVELSKRSPSTFVALKAFTGTNKPVLSCVYEENCTEIFKAIEAEQWADVAYFLDNAEWPGFALAPDFPPLEQTMTVVSGFDEVENEAWTYLPLHLSVLRGAPLAVIRRLIELAPNTVTVPDHEGNLALHLAMLVNSSYKVMNYIISKSPPAMSTRNAIGATPLQVAMDSSNKAAIHRARILLNFMKHGRGPPKTLKVIEIEQYCDYDTNCSPLFQKIAEEDWCSVDFFLAEGTWFKPNLLSEIMQTFFCGMEAGQVDPKDQVSTLVTKCDENKMMLWAQLPLHIAVLLKAPLPVIQKLVKYYPESLAFPDNSGMIPLHLALHCNAKDSVVAFLLDQFPESVRVPNMNSVSPVEIACQGEGPNRGSVIKAFMAGDKMTKLIKEPATE